MELLDELFGEEDREWILQIPLSKRYMEDELIWLGFQFGEFTVRSAYFVAREMLGKEVIDQQLRPLKWKLIWTSKVLPNIKYFAWLMVSGILPTRACLLNRGVLVDDNCGVCDMPGETAYHVLFECQLSVVIWSQLCPWLPLELHQWNSSSEIWNDVMIRAWQKGAVVRFLCGPWIIWHNRNNCRFNETCNLLMRW
ncbi:hypothetical protein REPUB_Repub14bG0093200 [Reevesia pubescens]